MKNCLRIALLLIVCNACSKSDPDPRDQYLGDYDVTYTAVGTTASGKPVTINQATKMTVVKGSESDKISFVEGKKYLNARLAGTKVTLDPIVSPDDPAYVTTGSGLFTKNSFTIEALGKGGNNYPTQTKMTGTKR